MIAQIGHPPRGRRRPSVSGRRAAYSATRVQAASADCSNPDNSNLSDGSSYRSWCGVRVGCGLVVLLWVVVPGDAVGRVSVVVGGLGVDDVGGAVVVGVGALPQTGSPGSAASRAPPAKNAVGTQAPRFW